MKSCINLIVRFWPLICIFFTLFFLFHTVLFPSLGKIIYGGDLATQFYFWKGYLVDSLKSGFIPFWNPYNFSGTPFLSHPATAFFYPGTLIYLLFPLNLAFSINYFLHFLIGGFGMYWLVRKYSDRFSSLIASLVFILSGYFAARIFAGHIDLLTTAVWIPWVFACFKEVLENGSKKHILKAIFFFSLMILAGYMAYVLFTMEFLLLYMLFFVIKKWILPRQSIKAKIFPFLFALGFSLLITCVQWFPTWQLMKFSIRGEGLPYDLASWGSLPLSGIKLFIDPFNLIELDKITYALGGKTIPNFFDHFIGRLPLIAIIIFVMLKTINKLLFPKQKNLLKINADFWFFLSVSLFFLWLSFGFYISPNLHKVFYDLIPFYRNIRIPIQHIVYLVFLVPLMLGIILSLIKNEIVKTFLLIIFVAELFNFSSRYLFLTDIPGKNYDQKLVNFLQVNNTEETRLLPHFRVISPVLDVFDFNSVMKYKIPSVSGYDPVILKNYYDFIDLANKSTISSLPFYNVEIPPLLLGRNVIDYLNIGYILSEKNENLESMGYQIVLSGELYNVYENRTKRPQFFLVNKIRVFDSRKYLHEVLMEDDIDFTKIVLLEKNELSNTLDYHLECDQKNTGEVKLISYTHNSIILKINAICNSFLSSSEVFYPEWKAKIDGLNTKIYQSNSAFRTIYLPKGEHKVEFYYLPEIYYLGGMISISSLIILIFVYRSQRNAIKR